MLNCVSHIIKYLEHNADKKNRMSDVEELFCGIRLWIVGASLIVASPVYAQTSLQKKAMASLQKTGAEVVEKCNATEDEKIQAAKQKAESFSTQQSGDKAVDPLAACQQVESANSDASKALSGFQSQCAPIVKKCSEDLKVLKGVKLSAALQKMKDACEKAEKDLSSLQAELGKTKAQTEASKQCQNDIGGGMPQMPQMPESKEEPTPTPTPEVAIEDCNNPKIAASSKVCQCSANPRAVGCGTDESPSVDALISDRSQAFDNTPMPSAAVPSLTNSAFQRSASGSATGAAGAGGSGVSASSSGPSQSEPGSSPFAPVKVAVAGGGGGGAAGAGSLGGGGGSKPGGGGYSEENTREPGSAQAANLNSFLPQLRKDGVTGPHTDLFRKVRTRYKANFENWK